jgi:L-asparaginase / beta-aspartyl-peptidase
MSPALIVHGGCGVPPAGEEADRLAACERAADEGWVALKGGGAALDAVEAAVRRLEDEPILNAGTGSYLQADGIARMDASVMTSDGRAGAVAQVPGLRNPVRLARYLLERDAHVMLSGPEALQLALSLGHEGAVVATAAKIQYWQEHLNDACVRLDYGRMAEEWKAAGGARLGTVGCVARDGLGRLAAATSTGGTGQCYPGRVGDTPILGAGTYCTPRAAVSLTGVGERIMVLLSARSYADLVAMGRLPEDAATQVLAQLQAVGGDAGLISVTADGGLVRRTNTPFMATAVRS